MKLLIYDWESYLQQDIKWVCREKGIQLTEFRWKFTNKNEDEAFEIWFRKTYCGTDFNALFSVNYWPLLSKVCQEAGLKYIAWCYDNPLNVVNIEATLGNSVNMVIFFDRVQTQRYLDAGFDTVYYLPLCVNRSRLQKLKLTAQDRKQYGAEVSFVGSLYESRLREIQALTDEYTKGYLDAAISVQQNVYGCYLFDEMITPEVIRNINEYIKFQHPDTEFRLAKEALTFAMASEVTRNDRLLLLTLLGRRYDTRLYSFQSSEILQEVKCFPPIDYVTEMPKVFATSKINLNPILRCIQSGIPLRALDVMAAGGFLLSSYQPELAEQFGQEEEMVLYESLEDAIEKAEFFLKHEAIRSKIAENGRRKVLEQYAMEDRLDQIFVLSGLG